MHINIWQINLLMQQNSIDHYVLNETYFVFF